MSPLSFRGFASPWCFLFLVLLIGVLVWYVLIQRSRQRRFLRFANLPLLEQISRGRRPRRWRHVPVALLAVAVALLTTAMAGPTHDIRVPRERAVVMLVIDVSESMAATDVSPSRIAAAREAADRFAEILTPTVNLGLVKFAANATLLVAPTLDRGAVKRAVDTLEPEPRTATGEGIFTALQSIASVGAVMGGGDGPPPARIVLESDGKETVPADPEAPRGAFTAARAAKEQGVSISTIAFGTPEGTVSIDGQRVPVPVDDSTLRRIAEISGGEPFHAGSLSQLTNVYSTLQQQLGYQVIRADASSGWIGLGALALACSIGAGTILNQRLPR